MGNTRQAHRVSAARRMIATAYRNDPTFDIGRASRFELLGDATALVRLTSKEPNVIVDIRLAQRLSSGKVVRLLRENRADFTSIKAVFKYLDELYGVHGGPSGEASRPVRHLSRPSLTLVR